jgi:hypothetical protein
MFQDWTGYSFRVGGGIASNNIVACIAFEEVRNTFTPADLYKGVATCVAEDKYDLAANLFALAGVYGRFDAGRVADESAAQATSVLIMNTFSAIHSAPGQR